MNTHKPTLEAIAGFYVTADGAYMPSIYDTDAGYFLHCEPVLCFDTFDLQKLTGLLEASLSNPNPITKAPHMPPRDLVMGPHLDVKTQNELEKKTIYVSIKRLDSGFKIVSLHKLANGLQDRRGPKAIEAVLPRETTYEQLATIIIEHLKSRKDLPAQNSRAKL